MDPFVALGAAGTIATFIEMSYKLVSNACSIYQSASGSSSEDEQLGIVIGELNKLSTSMLSTKPTLDRSDAEKSLDEVAERCVRLLSKLLDILSRSKTKDPHSLKQSAAAALRSKWAEREKKELEKQVGDCRALFHLQLTKIMGTDLVEGLKKLAKTGMANANEVAALRRHVVRLEEGVILSSIGKGAQEQLKALHQLSDSALRSITSRCILESLAFPELNQRYLKVGKAYSETYEWIFEDDPQKNEKALQGKMLFTQWLKSGDGIFHIAGKPGSGKSTLMKFVAKHDRTCGLLNTWASGRKLVFGKHFFWHPGGYLENSIPGLLRTLLYDILQQCLDLVPFIFPQKWDYAKDIPPQAPINLQFDEDELIDAFEQLFNNQNLYADRCFFIMIDGLDELRETRDTGHKDLRGLLLSWVEKTSGAVKICVSSREHDVLLTHFSKIQSIRLQDLTEGDIRHYVKDKLEKNENYRQMRKPDYDPDALVTQVTERASGVFLWVALVVRLLDDACDDYNDADNNYDAFDELQDRIDGLPRELEELFNQIFDSINDGDKKQSTQTFAIMLQLLGEYSPRFSLFRYSFLSDYNHNPNLTSDSNFIEQGYLREDEGALEKRLKRARRRLYKHCKGLLEVIESYDDLVLREFCSMTFIEEKRHHAIPTGHDKFTEFMDTLLNQGIGLVHRSIQEYLEQKFKSSKLQHENEKYDIVGAVCQTYVAELIAINIRLPGCRDTFYAVELLSIFEAISQLPKGTLQDECIAALHNLDKTRRLIYEPNILKFHALDTTFIPIMDSAYARFSVAHLAVSAGFCEYFTTADTSYLQRDIENGSLLFIIVHILTWPLLERSTHEKHIAMLRLLFGRGCSPNQTLTLVKKGRPDINTSLWSAFLLNIIIHEVVVGPEVAEAVLIFLEFGADPNLSFLEIDKLCDLCFFVNDSMSVQNLSPLSSPSESALIKINSQPNFLEQQGSWWYNERALFEVRPGHTTLREIMIYMNPPQLESILHFIDKNSGVQQVPALVEGTSCAPEPELLSNTDDSNADISEGESVAEEHDGDLTPADTDTTAGAGEKIRTSVLSSVGRALGNPAFTFALGILLAYGITRSLKR